MPWLVADQPTSDCWFVAALQRLVKGHVSLFNWISSVSRTLLRMMLTHEGTVSAVWTWHEGGAIPPRMCWLQGFPQPDLNFHVYQFFTPGRGSWWEIFTTKLVLFVPNQRETSSCASRDVSSAELALPIMTSKRSVVQTCIWWWQIQPYIWYLFSSILGKFTEDRHVICFAMLMLLQVMLLMYILKLSVWFEVKSFDLLNYVSCVHLCLLEKSFSEQQ